MSTSYIPVPVPEEHVPKVYALLAELDRGEVDEAPEAPAVDAALAKRMYEESWDTHQRLLAYLANHASEWIHSHEIAEALALKSGTRGLAGMFGAFGRRSKHRYGGAKPWTREWDQGREENKYRMEPEVAAWFKEAAAS